MNTKKHLPFSCISPNFIFCREYPDYPRLSGTGFFCYFPPYDYIFYVTAKHCVKDVEESSSNLLCIPLVLGENKHVRFSARLSTADLDNIDCEEDLCIYLVDITRLTNEEKSDLKRRCVKLRHQDEIDFLMNSLFSFTNKVRAIGYPIHKNSKTEIDYEKVKATVQPRGFHGIVMNNSAYNRRFAIEAVNWNEGEYRGFSGSPVFALLPDGDSVDAVVIGMVLTGGSDRVEFLGINAVTDLVAAGILNNFTCLKQNQVNFTDC
jgi:hypothetical protein